MFRRWISAVVLLFLLSWMAAAQDAKTIISNASKAMGADSLKTIEYSGTGTEFAFGQAVNPSSAWPGFQDKSYKRTINYETPAWRIDRVLADIPQGRRGGGLPPGPNQVVVINPNSQWAQIADLWITPYGFLKNAAKAAATVKSQNMGGKKYNVVSFTAPSKAEVKGYINDQNMVEKVETWVDSLMGDTLLEASYANYKDFGGVKFPTTIVQKQGGYPTLDLTITEVKPNSDANIQAPQRGGGGGGGQQPAATSQKLADGVYAILPAYAALAVDFKDYIVIIEGPQSEARAIAIIDEAKKLIPNKPIKYVVNTHGHFDHAGGLRTFAAEGATIITHKVNKGYYEKIFAAPHTLVPDRLFSSKKKVNVELVGDKKVLTDGNHTIELHRVQGSNHNDGLLIAYLPKEKVLVEADGFNPPAQPNAPVTMPYNANTLNLVDTIEKLHLDVETIVPVHYPADGRKVTKAELMRAVGK